MVSNSKLVENLIYIDGYMTPVSNEYDYEEIQKMSGNRWDTSSLIRRLRKISAKK